MYDKEYLGEWDLQGRDVTVTIARVTPGELHVQESNKKKKSPLVYFDGKEKALVCNHTNGATIAQMYGPKTEGWIGKSITLFPSTTHSPKGVVPCIRVRPEVPK